MEGVRVLDLTRVSRGRWRATRWRPTEPRCSGWERAPSRGPGAGDQHRFRKAILPPRPEDFGRERRAARPGRRGGRVRAVVSAGGPQALGFGPRELARSRPGIVCVDISAYGSRGPGRGRRGFDSLVQMACGIAHEGGDGSRPHPLPAQVLDHVTGYLAAFGAMAARPAPPTVEGGSWRVRLSLAGTAHGWTTSAGSTARPRRSRTSPI